MGKKEKVEKLKELLRSLGENEFREVANIDVDGDYTVEIGYAFKNGRGSYQIRLRRGITNVLKIRNSIEFENMKALIDFLDKHRYILEVLDELNQPTVRRTVSSDAVEL